MPETRALIRDIEKKDRHFRIAQAIFSVLLLTITAASLLLALNILQNVQKQQEKIFELQQQLSASVTDLKQSNAAGLQKANQHLDCIALFFATPNRLNKTLTGCDVNLTPVAPQASSGVSSKVVTVAPSPQPQLRASQSNPSAQQPQKSSSNKFQDSVQKVINNLKRSL